MLRWQECFLRLIPTDFGLLTIVRALRYTILRAVALQRCKVKGSATSCLPHVHLVVGQSRRLLGYRLY